MKITKLLFTFILVVGLNQKNSFSQPLSGTNSGCLNIDNRIYQIAAAANPIDPAKPAYMLGNPNTYLPGLATDAPCYSWTNPAPLGSCYIRTSLGIYSPGRLGTLSYNCPLDDYGPLYLIMVGIFGFFNVKRKCNS
jgi:hypothetical protein